jgi:HlyD family secretion protein
VNGQVAPVEPNPNQEAAAVIQPRDNVIQAFRSQNRRPALVVAGLSLVALALAVLIGRDVFFPPAPAAAAIRTASVTRGTVRSSVTGTGSVVPATQVNVGFRSAGQLTEVDVKVGDHVSKGQVLARIDTRALQIALDQANANLQTAQANLGNTVNGNALVQAQHSLDNARTSYGDTVNQVNLTNQQDAAQLAADQAQYNTDNAQLTQDQTQYNTDYAKQQADLVLLNAGPYPTDKAKLATDQTQLLVDEDKYTLDGCATAGSTAQCQTDFNKIQQDQYDISQDQAKLAQDQAAVNADNTAVTADSAKVAADQAKLAADQTKINADNSKIASDQLSGQRSINQAQNAITSAQDAYNAQSVSRPNTIAGQQSAVQNAQSGVDTAQLNLDNATLTSPMDGVVNSLNGQVGEFVSASGGTTAQAPGSTAPVPTTSSSSSGSATSSAFTVLSNDQAFQVVVPFAEADAGRIVSGLSATVGFDAIQGLSIPSHVLATAATATVTSNVVNYNATLTLEQTDKRIRSGQTANVTVVVAQASNVLVVPNSAITRIGQRAFVSVLQPDGNQVRTLVTLGVAGDSSTEISSGVKEGEKLVLPQLRASTTTAGRGTGAGAGGGAVRIGGGG